MKKILQLITFAIFLATGHSAAEGLTADDIASGKSSFKLTDLNSLEWSKDSDEYEPEVLNIANALVNFVHGIQNENTNIFDTDELDTANKIIAKVSTEEGDLKLDVSADDIDKLKTFIEKVFKVLLSKSELQDIYFKIDGRVLKFYPDLTSNNLKEPHEVQAFIDVFKSPTSSPQPHFSAASSSPQSPANIATSSPQRSTASQASNRTYPQNLSLEQYLNNPDTNSRLGSQTGFAYPNSRHGDATTSLKDDSQVPQLELDRVNNYVDCRTCNNWRTQATPDGNTTTCPCVQQITDDGYETKNHPYIQGDLLVALKHYASIGMLNLNPDQINKINAIVGAVTTAATAAQKTNENPISFTLNAIIDQYSADIIQGEADSPSENIKNFITKVKEYYDSFAQQEYVREKQCLGAIHDPLLCSLLIDHYVPAQIAARAIALCDASVGQILNILNITYQMYDNFYVHLDIVAQMLTNHDSLAKRERIHQNLRPANPSDTSSEPKPRQTAPVPMSQNSGVSPLTEEALSQLQGKASQSNNTPSTSAESEETLSTQAPRTEGIH